MRKIAIPMMIAALFAIQACSSGRAGSSHLRSVYKNRPCSYETKEACRRVDGQLYVAR